MRFLQTEWHRHERDRNAWEIERAEMKSRIGKLEGDGRTAKRLQETLGKHVKMLETALRREREKTKKMQAGEKADGERTDSSNANESNDVRANGQEYRLHKLMRADLYTASKPPKSVLEAATEDSGHGEIKHDTEREKSRLYLGKCVQEVTYHVVPTTVAQQSLAEEQEQLMQGHQYSNQIHQLSMEDLYVQQQRQKQQPNHIGVVGPPPSMPNHQPPPVPRVSDVPPLTRQPQQSEQAAYMARSHPESQVLSQSGPITSIDTRNSSRPHYGFPPVSMPDDQIEKVSHSYDSYGQQISPRDEETNARTTEENVLNEPEAWNFEVDADPVPDEGPPPDYSTPQRPDTDAFPSAHNIPLRSPPRGAGGRRKSSISKRRQSDGSHELRELSLSQGSGSMKGESATFKIRFALRGHLDVVRSVIFTGGGTPAEPEICTTGDDGTIKRWIIPASYSSFGHQGSSSSNDLDVPSYFTHRGHTGSVTCLAAAPASPNFLNGGRALGDGWVFSGGQDATVRVWERGRVDPKATLDGHTDAVWTVCVLPGSSASIFGDKNSRHGGPERMLLASGSSDGTILIWAVSSPPQLTSPSSGSRRGAGGSRRANSVSSGSNFPSSPQPSTATTIPFLHSLVHRIERVGHPSPTCISPLSPSGDNFVVSYTDASVLVYDTRSAEEVIGMASLETYDETPATAVNAVAATTAGLERTDPNRSSSEDENRGHGATGSSSGVEGMVLSGHEDRYIRFFDANSGKNLRMRIPRRGTRSLLHRSMHLQHARASIGHIRAVLVSRRPGTRLGWARCQPSPLVLGEALLHAGDHISSTDAGRRGVRGRVERGWAVDRQRWRRRDGQGLGAMNELDSG